jgi:hypothetical protein
MSNVVGAQKTLWTPDGNVPVREKDVVPITRNDLGMLAMLHRFAQTHGLIVVCERCDTSLGGKNNGHEANPSVACQCREFRFIP